MARRWPFFSNDTGNDNFHALKRIGGVTTRRFRANELSLSLSLQSSKFVPNRIRRYRPRNDDINPWYRSLSLSWTNERKRGVKLASEYIYGRREIREIEGGEEEEEEEHGVSERRMAREININLISTLRLTRYRVFAFQAVATSVLATDSNTCSVTISLSAAENKANE